MTRADWIHWLRISALIMASQAFTFGLLSGLTGRQLATLPDMVTGALLVATLSTIVRAVRERNGS